MSAIGILTRGYIDEVRPATADIPAFPSAKAQEDAISVNASDSPATVAQAQSDGVNIKPDSSSGTVLPVDDSTTIKIIPC